jgi:hypothetical protein
VSVAALSATVKANETPMSNTINSGTVLIEENAFTAESLRFESEPWTRFYMAGEVIRESRKASEKPNPCASKGNSEAQVLEEGECQTVGCGPEPASSSLPTELVQRQGLEEALAIKNTDIVPEFSLPPCTPVRCHKLPQNWWKAALGSLVF